MNITVTWNKTGEVIFQKNLSVSPEDRYTYDVQFPEPGNYTIRTTWNGTVYTYVWHLETTDPSSELLVRYWDGRIRYTGSAA